MPDDPEARLHDSAMSAAARDTTERPPRPAAKVCGQCGDTYDDWVWDEQDQEWENDFEWWQHKESDHGFLCCRWCWVKVHRAHCGEGNPCRETSAKKDEGT